MSPKQRQNNAQRPKRSENAYNGLADPPHDGSNPTCDGKDGKVDEVDGNSAGKPFQSVILAGSPVPSASTQQQQATTEQSRFSNYRRSVVSAINWAALVDDNYATHDQLFADSYHEVTGDSFLGIQQIHQHTQRCFNTLDGSIRNNNDAMRHRFDIMMSKFNILLEENTKLRAAYKYTQAETAALQAAVDALTKKIDEQEQVISAPPSPNLTVSSSAMKEMTMQLSVVQHDIQDVLDAVRNPPRKRKQRGSDQNTEPTSPTNRRPVNHKPRVASPMRSLMQSKHATTAAEDKLDARKPMSPQPLLAITLTEATPEPQPGSSSVQDTPLPDAPSTAPAETNGWKSVEAKATQWKQQKAKETIPTAATPSKTPTTKNGGRGKNTHQPRQATPSTKKTWAELVKSGGINVQIVLGNGNLGLTTPLTRRGERQGGAARRLRKKEGEGERGEEKRGRAGPGVSKGKESGDTGGGGERGEESGGAGGPEAV